MNKMSKKLIIIVVIIAVCVLALSIFLILSHDDNNGAEDERWIDEGDHYRGRGDLKADEIKDIFYRNEEAFEYIVSFLKSFDKVGYEIRILRETDEIIIRRAAGDFTYAGWGFPEDEIFKKYVFSLLIDEPLGKIIVHADGDISFGPNSPITYSETGRELHMLKENWYFNEHRFV
jgi:hypothetical protein